MLKENFIKIIFVAAGGALGSVLRYASSAWLNRILRLPLFPWGTFAVNAAGSLLIGILWGVAMTHQISSGMKVFLFAGLLGGFTTYSSFSMESMNLLRTGHLSLALIYIVSTNLLCIGAAYCGFIASRIFSAA